MQKYFEPFKKIPYTFDSRGLNKVAVVNIFQRSAFLKSLYENIDVFYDYILKDGDNFEILATNYYGDAQYHWIIMLFNNIVDPYYSLPLSRERLDQYIIKKYGLVNASALHHYELRTVIEESINNTLINKSVYIREASNQEVNHDTGSISNRTSLPSVGQTIELENKVVVIDSATLRVIDSITGISNYRYEYIENEKKRNIKLIRKELIPGIETEFRRLMTAG